jgi:hypothetical protein
MRATLFGATTCLTLAALTLLMASPVAAQGALSPAERQVAQACRADISSHCANVERGGGRIAACLRQNSDKLSSGCRQALSTLQR